MSSMTSLRPRRKAASGSVKGIFSSEKYLLFFGKTSRSSFSSERCVLRKERRTGEGYAARAKGKGRGPADAWKADAQWQDSQWQVASWDDCLGITPRSPTQPKAKERTAKRANEKASMARTVASPKERTAQSNLQILPRAAPRLRPPSMSIIWNLGTFPLWPPKRRTRHSSFRL